MTIHAVDWALIAINFASIGVNIRSMLRLRRLEKEADAERTRLRQLTEQYEEVPPWLEHGSTARQKRIEWMAAGMHLAEIGRKPGRDGRQLN